METGLRRWSRVTVLLLGMGSLGALLVVVHAQDEYMTCSRPVKSSRASRQHVESPCQDMEHGKESYCNLPGPTYPWHAVRRFVFENQGLMRRMYGEVRQLSLLRMEFSGESNALEESSRDFDELFKPVTTFGPSSTFSSFLTTEMPPTLVVTSGSDEPLSASAEPSSSSSSPSTPDPDDETLLTTVEGTTTEEMGSGGGSGLAGGITEEPLPETTVTPAVGSGEESLVLPVPLTRPASAEEEEKTRTEGQILFQDFERVSESSPAPSSTAGTTEEIEARIRTTNKVGVNACPVKEEVVAPYWANNTRGEILALLNLYPFEQYIHWEKCTNEHKQMYCRDGCRCEQQYRLHRLLAFDPQNECRGIFSDWFRFPSCCVCKCYFDDYPTERITFNRSPRIFPEPHLPIFPYQNKFGGLDVDGPDVNGVDDSHFFYKYASFRQPRK